MKLKFDDYKSKVLGCWMGKNIGGVLGAPLEGRRGVHDVWDYIQDLSAGPPPNDDLDLQIIWLHAVEKYGRNVNASILGEYWLSFTIPDWVEYGAGKANLSAGLVPPLSGYHSNVYRNSCGCFIRSEIWACLAPGIPDMAAAYAYEDAIVDHAEEGMHGEVFCAALQSAAFVESDYRKLVDIALSYIPDDCAVARAVKTAVDSYEKKLDWKQARVAVLKSAPGTFGVQGTRLTDIDTTEVPLGKPGFDAPGNVGIMILGLMYGEGDFGKSICIANNCGEDTDCTAATLGAVLGIILGKDGIPEKWSAPIGDQINTLCINKVNGEMDVPGTCAQLTDRILRAAPLFLGRWRCDLFADKEGYAIYTNDNLYCERDAAYVPGINGYGKPRQPNAVAKQKESPYTVHYAFPAFDALVDYTDGPGITAGKEKKIKVSVYDNNNVGCRHQWLTIKWYTPDGVAITPPVQSFFMRTTYKTVEEFEFTVFAENIVTEHVDLICDISSNGRHSHGLIKVRLMPN